MNTVLYFSRTGTIFETRAYTQADIAHLVDDHGLQCLTSADGQIDFWFTPSTQGCQRGVNRKATELLLATTKFNAKSVPLLRGCVVVATHDTEGDLDGLSWQQLDILAEKSHSLTRREERVLARRMVRDSRGRKNTESSPARTLPAAKPRTVVSH